MLLKMPGYRTWTINPDQVTKIHWSEGSRHDTSYNKCGFRNFFRRLVFLKPIRPHWSREISAWWSASVTFYVGKEMKIEKMESNQRAAHRYREIIDWVNANSSTGCKLKNE